MMMKSRVTVAVIATIVVIMGSVELVNAQSKESTLTQMQTLGNQIQVLKAEGEDTAAEVADLLDQYAQLSALLGGDDPARLLSGTQSPGGQRAAPAAPPNCAAASTGFTDTTTLAISDNTNVQGSLAVSGVGTYLMDVDLTTVITHTFPGDLEISLTSPAGTTVVITTDNGSGSDDVFNGTLFDDQALVPATDATYTNGVTATPLAPEGALASFNGEDPNGTWLLDIYDDAGGDTGQLSSFTLTVTTLDAAPTYVASGPFVESTPVAIADNTAIQSTLVVSGAESYLWDLNLTTFITHTFPGDLEISLTSPAGTTVVITTDNGGGSDDVFNGTIFNDQALVPATDAVYTDGVTASPLAPEGALAAFNGEDPNGTWQIDIYDDAGGDIGSLDSWSLDVVTASCAVMQQPAVPALSSLGIALFVLLLAAFALVALRH